MPEADKNKNKVDPCGDAIESYLKCVDSKPRGLSEGDECTKEANLYKLCVKSYTKKNYK